MKRLLVALLFSVVALSGCATRGNFENYVNKFIGWSEGELISSWGIPSQVYESGGTKYVKYGAETSGQVGTVTNFYGSPIYMSRNTSRFCEVTFSLVNDSVTEWRMHGNACTM